ncbi:MAG: hypothetical protein ABL888_07635 [Pirellulaceae bacterium]
MAELPRLGIVRKARSQQFCEARKYSLFVAPDFSQVAPRRVVIIPTGMEAGGFQAPFKFAEILADSIRGCGLCEVFVPNSVDCRLNIDHLLAGQFEERDISRLAHDYQCDAVLFLRVNSLKAFPPLQTSITTALVDANESVVVFAMDGNWDINDREIRESFEQFNSVANPNQNESEFALQMRSPNRLFHFVAHQTTQAWQEAKSTGF